MFFSSMIVYYCNLIKTKFLQKYVIKYDIHTYSSYFNIPRKYCGRWTLPTDEAHRCIVRMIESDEAFLIARYGSSELYNMEIFDLNFKPKYKIALYTLTNNAGFFPDDLFMARKFAAVLAKASREVDMLAFWNMFREEYYIKKYMSFDTKLFQLRFLEPWFSSTPWTSALENKKVLVIHPFVDTIRKQFERREELFPGTEILPEFQLYTLKAIQSIGGKCNQFHSWFEALDWMTQEALKIDFDIALIGCGAYGMPLAANLKKTGKKAIHMGGVLQILFGIKGRRWDSDPVVSQFYNESWVSPDESEKPQNANSVEGGCYW